MLRDSECPLEVGSPEDWPDEVVKNLSRVSELVKEHVTSAPRFDFFIKLADRMYLYAQNVVRKSEYKQREWIADTFINTLAEKLLKPLLRGHLKDHAAEGLLYCYLVALEVLS